MEALLKISCIPVIPDGLSCLPLLRQLPDDSKNLGGILSVRKSRLSFVLPVLVVTLCAALYILKLRRIENFQNFTNLPVYAF